MRCTRHWGAGTRSLIKLQVWLVPHQPLARFDAQVQLKLPVDPVDALVLPLEPFDVAKVPFKATAYHNGSFVEVTQDVLKGRWSVFVFYPADFTFVCPTELGDLADNYAEFQKLGAEIYSVSTDTHFTHKAWHDTSDTIRKIRFPMLADPTGALSRNFQVMIEDEGLALRGTFIVNPQGQIKAMEVNDNGIGRDAKELLRRLKAAKYVAEHPGEVCPAKWQEGAETLKPSLDLVGKI